MAKDILFEITHGEGITVVGQDFQMNKVVGIAINGDLLRSVVEMDEDAKIEFKLDLIRQFQDRLNRLF